jgi:N-formylglutamate deformylase
MQVFTLHLPRAPEVPIVANLPHSGQGLPAEHQARFLPSFLQQLPNTDWYLDRLYKFLPDLGITVLQANYSRYCVDLNRRLQEPLLGNFWQSVVPAQTAFNQPIYQTMPSPTEVEARIATYYLPYHQQLKALLEAKIAQFGQVYLLDLHSFYGLISDQICLGNANGQTCSEQLITLVEGQFQQQGYQVVRNKVFSGGYITRHYGELPQVEALQIETRCTVYLDTTQLEQPTRPDWDVPEFAQAQTQFAAIFAAIVGQLI